MKICAYFGRKLEHLCNLSRSKVGRIHKSSKTLINNSSFDALIFQTSPFWIQLVYFLFISVVGYLALKISKPRSAEKQLNNLDIFFTSVSSATVSSMATLEMEVFSNTQLIIITILMSFGGEVFLSMLGLQFKRFKFHTSSNNSSLQLAPVSVDSDHLQNQKPENDMENNIVSLDYHSTDHSLKFAALKSLGYVVLGYLLVVHVSGSSLVAMYATLVPSTRKLLAEKGIKIRTFSTFVTVSTFANCGFVPTSENMVVFKKNPGLLLLLIPQILSGNCLYGPSLRFVIWVLEKLTKRVEYSYMLRNSREMGHSHLMPSVNCRFIVTTVFGFIALQFMVFCCLEWNSALMDGLSAYEKTVAALFEVVNARHAGESVFDLSAISPAILVIFVVMMYFPPYTTYLPLNEEEEEESRRRKETRKNERKKMVEYLLFSQLSYLVIFIVLICIAEREKLKNDPLNFNVLNITMEVISAYGNVGFSTGYSCERQIKAESSCKDEWIGFVGKWTIFGKFILIIVMFFGKLRKFNKNGGKHWNLS